MPRVFVPQLPSRYDTAIEAWVPTVNMYPAEKHGEIVVLLRPEASRLGIAPIVEALKDRLQDYNTHDYIVAVGDPSIMAAAVLIAAKKCQGQVRMLKWDRLAKDYIPVEFKV